MKYSNGTSTVLCISLSELVSCAFSTIPICPFLIPGIFHLLVYIALPVVKNMCIIQHRVEAKRMIVHVI